MTMSLEGVAAWGAVAYVSYNGFQNKGHLILPILPILATQETEKLIDPR